VRPALRFARAALRLPASQASRRSARMIAARTARMTLRIADATAALAGRMWDYRGGAGSSKEHHS
jgi:hypothetical protein